MVGMDTTTLAGTRCVTETGIGPVGVAARIAVGLVFVVAALWRRDPGGADVVVGPVMLPAVAVGLLDTRG